VQKTVLVNGDGQSRLVQGDPDSERLAKANADNRALAVLLGESWRITGVTASSSQFLVVLEKP
jgi:hypothetical protein